MVHPHFVLYARDLVEKSLGPEMVSKGGLKIYTTLDPRIQDIAEEEVQAQIARLAGQGASNGALVAVRPGTGEILAMVGSADFDNESISGQINMAISPRQPGSSIKPLTYLAAFEMPAAAVDDKATPSDELSAIEPAGGWNPATAILDIRTEFPDGANPPYVPSNYDDKEHGVVSVRAALANSYNIPAVKALQHIGLDRLKGMAVRLGITTLTRPDYGLSLTLGGGEVTLVEMTGAYAALANGGVRAPVTPIACVIGSDGKIVWSEAAGGVVEACQAAAAQPGPAPVITPAPAQAVVDPKYVYLITSILSDLEARRPAFGQSATLLSLADRPAAAKTGTTNDYRDAWTLGYTPDLAVGVWVGNADYTPMQQLAGSTGAAPIWHNVMSRSLEGSPPQPFTEPQGIQHIAVCADSGTLPSEACPSQWQDVFASDHGPLPAKFDLHQRVRLDRSTGQPATDFTPAERVEVRDVMVFPPRYKAWAEAHGFPQVNLEGPKYAFAPELELKQPANNSQVADLAQVSGRIHLPEPLVWRLEYGVGPSPLGWGVVRDTAAEREVDGRLADWDVRGDGGEAWRTRLFAAAGRVRSGKYGLPCCDIERDLRHWWWHLPPPSRQRPRLPSRWRRRHRRRQPRSPCRPIRHRPRRPWPLRRPARRPTDLPSPTPTEALPATSLPPTATEQPPAETATATATAEPTVVQPAQAGPELQAVITQPAAGAQVSASQPVAVTGIADGRNYVGYQLEFAAETPEGPVAWQMITPPNRQSSADTGGLLGTWRTEALEPGDYVLAPERGRRTGTVVSTEVRVIVQP